jgi:hypothetical protein
MFLRRRNRCRTATRTATLSTTNAATTSTATPIQRERATTVPANPRCTATSSTAASTSTTTVTLARARRTPPRLCPDAAADGTAAPVSGKPTSGRVGSGRVGSGPLARRLVALPGHGERVTAAEPGEVLGDDVLNPPQTLLIGGLDPHSEDARVDGQFTSTPRGEGDGACRLPAVGLDLHVASHPGVQMHPR